jgi:hypothetical protein
MLPEATPYPFFGKPSIVQGSLFLKPVKGPADILRLKTPTKEFLLQPPSGMFCPRKEAKGSVIASIHIP